MLLELWSIVAPVLICAILGFCWGRSTIPYEAEFVSQIVMSIGVPCLILSVFHNADISLDAFLQMAGLALIIMLGTTAIGALIIRLTKGDFYALLPPVVFSNSGNMGIPLSLFAFGQQGLALGVSYFMVLITVHMTLGVALLSPETKRFSIQVKALLHRPLSYAIALSLLLMATGSKLPFWLANTVNLLGGLSIPLMLITLGVSLSRLKSSTWKTSLGYAFVRMAGGLAMGILAVQLLDAKGVVRNVALLQSMMPAAVFNYLLALRFNREPETVAGTVIISTLLAFITVPLLLAYLQT